MSAVNSIINGWTFYFFMTVAQQILCFNVGFDSGGYQTLCFHLNGQYIFQDLTLFQILEWVRICDLTTCPLSDRDRPQLSHMDGWMDGENK